MRQVSTASTVTNTGTETNEPTPSIGVVWTIGSPIVSPRSIVRGGITSGGEGGSVHAGGPPQVSTISPAPAISTATDGVNPARTLASSPPSPAATRTPAPSAPARATVTLPVPALRAAAAARGAPAASAGSDSGSGSPAAAPPRPPAAELRPPVLSRSTRSPAPTDTLPACWASRPQPPCPCSSNPAPAYRWGQLHLRFALRRTTAGCGKEASNAKSDGDSHWPHANLTSSGNVAGRGERAVISDADCRFGCRRTVDKHVDVLLGGRLDRP